MSRRNVLGLLGIAPRLRGGGFAYLLRDDFTTAASAPLTSPRTAEPGPGTLTITDTNNKLSIATDELTFATGGAGAGDPGAWGAIQTRVVGRAVVGKVLASTNIVALGWDTDQTALVYDSLRVGSSFSISSELTHIAGDTLAASTEYQLAVVQRGTGCLFFVKGGAFASWTLFWVGGTSSASVYPSVVANANTSVGTLDTFRVLDLPAPFATDYGLATDREAGSVSAGTTFTHEADFVGEYTITTLPSAGNLNFYFRIQDAENRWLLQTDNTGSLGLYEQVAGGFTARGAVAAGTLANGHRVVVVANSSTIRVYSNNVLRITYSSASNFATETDGLLSSLGTGGAVSDIVSWPRALTGAAAAILDAAVA